MPGLTPDRSSANILIVHHRTAAHFLSATFPTLRRHEESANIVFAHALKLLGSEAALTGCHFTNESDVCTWWKQETRLARPFSSSSSASSSSSSTNHVISTRSSLATATNFDGDNNNNKNYEPFWLTVWSSPSPFVPPTLDVVLSCVSWTLGDYPIFLWTPKSPTSLSPSWLAPRVEVLAERLLDIVPPQRVFSIFGMTPLVKSFTRYWSDLVKCPIELEPFYAAYYSFCNLETFKESGEPLPRGDSIRRAKAEDLAAVAQLCKEFADDTALLNRAIYRYIFHSKLMLRRVKLGSLSQTASFGSTSPEGEVTSICAVTRSTQNVSAITKVYTTPKWRRRGFAEHLVRNVTRRLLIDCGKRSVTLYVGHNNSAQRVYDRVGFVGLCGKEKANGVEDSLELGLVTGGLRGHW
ncbi:hypothetical protein F5148DRAFT_1153315 [Russula earlei]|uniref:Uncharacterized protein n=1 Tax=Russula earlei TaxID=71964 RepID=A0ACC0TVP1_9AGAM|nr:hypothetical protein F5148DRAFT_1153315 [Russula earlei]